MSPRLEAVSDEPGRQLAQKEFDHPVAVEAGAGTGKTTVLVARIIAWCLGFGWSQTRHRLVDDRTPEPRDENVATRVLEGLVAITFTEAAAAQMARRVAEALATLAADPSSEVVGFYPELLPASDPALLQKRAKALIGALDRLAIRTIHSHCWHLLSSYPMAAGLSPDLQVDAEGRQLDELVREIVEEATREAYAGSSDHPLHRLAIRGVDPRAVATAVLELVSEGCAAEAFDRDPLTAECRSEIRSQLMQTLITVQRQTRPITGQTRAKKDLEVAEAVDRSCELLLEVPADLDTRTLADVLDQLRQIWDDSSIARLVAWSRGDFTQTVDQLVGDGRVELSRSAGDLVRSLRLCQRLDVEVLDAGRRALQPLIARVEDELRARGVVTYSSLMTEAWKLLKDPLVLRSERRRLDQLLVDEFQDTDSLQCDLVRFLALGGEKSERPGLFVVGDPKQSIYGWRNADLEAYEEFIEDLRAAGGVCVALDRNFRSVPPILEEVDRTIGSVMTAEPGLQPTFASLVACDSLLSDGGFEGADRAPIEYWVSWGEEGAKTRADDVAHNEADAIAADIRNLHEGEKVPWNEFGLLLRSTSRLETYLGSFRQAGVPFVVTSDKHYFRRREIIEAAALVRTVIVPVDHLALVTFLRSATVGVPDAALLPLWRGRFPELATRLNGPDTPELDELRSLVQAVAADLPPHIPGLDQIHGWELNLVASLENLAFLRQSFINEPADRFIDHLRQRFLFDVTESARHLGVYRLANLDRFFRELERSLEEQDGDIQSVLRTLRRSVAESQDSEQALPEGATQDAVQVMTIHGAKGLEFSHVYLPQLHSRGRQNQKPDIRFDRRWMPDREAEYVLFGSPTPGFDRVEMREAEIERTEQIRTLYVAMTRARNRLVLLGKWPAAPQPVPVEKRVTYLDLLRSRPSLPESLAELEDTCRSDKTSFADRGGIRWRFPILDSRSNHASAKGSAKPNLPTIKVVKQQAARLTALQQAAAVRMSRRFSGAASDEAAARLTRLASDEIPFEDLPATREIALSVGSAFHRMMETWRLTDDPDSELARQREIQLQWLASMLAAPQVEPALGRFEELLDRFQRSQFLERFTSMKEDSLAREVPILVPPADTETGPVGFVTGFIDLLCRDPSTESWIIVDYKTDRVEKEAEISDRAQTYSLQEAVYAKAIQESLGLDSLPATQLWFIWSNILWERRAQS